MSNVQTIEPDTQEFFKQNEGVLSGLSLSPIHQVMAERSLREYIELAWPILEPKNKFIPGWHIDAIAEHLEAISKGQIRNLIINMPPRCMKSLGVCAFWPSWDWGPHNRPETRFLFSSYADSLAIRDSRKTRNLIQSKWYQEKWGDKFKLTGDQNAKQRFENNKQGYRIATTVDGTGTGEGGDVICVDDPHNVRKVESVTKRISTLLWWDESMSTRGDNPETVAFLIIMQRSHPSDLAGHELAKETGYEHLCMPMEYEGENKIFTSLGKPDPRQEEGELLWPERYNAAAVDVLKKKMNSRYAVAGQLQQRPVPREGGEFNIDDFVLVRTFDRSSIIRSIRYWDKAGTEGGGKRTAGVLMHKLKEEIRTEDGDLVDTEESYLIEDVVKGHWGAPKRERRISNTAKLDGKKVTIWIEQEPGSGGKESAEATVKRNAGYTVKVDKVTGAKETRCEPYESQVAIKNVRLLIGTSEQPAKWVKEFLEEHEMYGPSAEFKDQIDAAGGAFNKLAGAGEVFFG